MPVVTLTFTVSPLPTAIVFTSVTRDDTGGTVGFTTNWANPSSGVFQGTFVAPVAGLSYAYAATATISGAASPFSGTYVDVSTGYVGRYTTSAKVKRRFGSINVAAYSDTTGGDTADETAIQDSIVWAEDEIDARFTGSGYTIPFTATGSSLPAVIQEWATVLAGNWLYTKRGLRDEKAGGDLKSMTDMVDKAIALYVGGLRHLPGVDLRSGASPAVTLVEPTTGRISDGANLDPTSQSRDFGRRYGRQTGITYQP